MTRGETGRGSAGPRDSKRILDRDEIMRRRDEILATPQSAERKQALRKIRGQLRSIEFRTERGGV